MSRLGIVFLTFFAIILAGFLAWLGLITLPANLLGWFLLLVGGAYAIGVPVVFWLRRRRFWETLADGKTLQEESGDHSFWGMTLGMVACFFLPPLEYAYLPGLLPRNGWMQVAGLGCIGCGVLLFLWARRSLGAFYSGHVTVVEGQHLLQTGPYRLIRHPAYAGYLLMSLGIGLGYSSLSGLVAFLVVLLPGLIYRIHIEDRLLFAQFGNHFLDYAARTRRLIPGIW